MQRLLFYVIFIVMSILTACGTDGNPDPQCPALEPRAGAACSSTALRCYYAWACDHDSTGTLASCEDGFWTISHDSIKQTCAGQPVREGDTCPCADFPVCRWSCTDGSTLTARCDATTLTWKYDAPPTCTVAASVKPAS